jgi:hypothetical protein
MPGPLNFVCFLKKPYNYPTMRKCALLVLFALVSNYANGQNYKSYSIYIYSFTRHVIWPDDYNQGEFEILVLGDTPMLEELNTLAQAKKVGERPIKVTKIESTSEIRKCNILFVPAAKASQLADIIAKVAGLSVAVVSESPGAGTQGSHINFVTKEGKLAFEINQAALGKNNLKITNMLSGLAILI